MDTLNPFDVGYSEPEISEDVTTAEAPAARVATGLLRLTSAEYHADPAPAPSLSATLAKLALRKSMRHAWHACRRLNPLWEPVEKKTFDIGRAAHRAVLGCGDDYVAIPVDLLASNEAASTKEAKAFIASTREAGCVPLKEDECAAIEAMRIAAHARLAEHGVTLDPARSELSAVVEIDGIYCRAMFDNAPQDPALPLYDFKTCEDASPEACLRSVLKYGYDVQAEHYRAVWKAATGEDRKFVFIFQEKGAPHEVTLVSLSGQFQHFAQRRAAKARSMWREALKTGEWPGYPTGMHEIDAPAWLIEREFQEQF